MTTIRTSNELRQEMNNKVFSSSLRIPVIVTIPFSKRKQDLGLQFWTKEMIANGNSINTDGTISKFVELY